MRRDENSSLNSDCGSYSAHDQSLSLERDLETARLTIIRLEEFDESEIEPQPIPFTNIIQYFVVIRQLENVWTDSTEPRIFSKSEDSRDELIWTDSGLEDWM